MGSSWGSRRSAPWAFTEQGVVMLSSVLRSEKAAQLFEKGFSNTGLSWLMPSLGTVVSSSERRPSTAPAMAMR